MPRYRVKYKITYEETVSARNEEAAWEEAELERLPEDETDIEILEVEFVEDDKPDDMGIAHAKMEDPE